MQAEKTYPIIVKLTPPGGNQEPLTRVLVVTGAIDATEAQAAAGAYYLNLYGKSYEIVVKAATGTNLRVKRARLVVPVYEGALAGVAGDEPGLSF